METDLNKLRDRAYKIAKEHGSHEKEMSDETYLMLIITEISEAVNADRKGDRAKTKAWSNWISKFAIKSDKDFESDFEHYVKDTVEDELADTVIRLLDFAGVKEAKVKEAVSFNIRGNFSFIENCFYLSRNVTDFYWKESIEDCISLLISNVFQLAKLYDIDLFKFINLKMKYNELRPDGKKY